MTTDSQHRWNNGRAANVKRATQAAKKRYGEKRPTPTALFDVPSLGFKDSGNRISAARYEAFIDRVFT